MPTSASEFAACPRLAFPDRSLGDEVILFPPAGCYNLTSNQYQEFIEDRPEAGNKSGVDGPNGESVEQQQGVVCHWKGIGTAPPLGCWEA